MSVVEQMRKRKAQRMRMQEQLQSMRRQNCVLSHKLHRLKEEKLGQSMVPPMVPRNQLCEFFGVNTNTIARWVRKRGFPKGSRVGKSHFHDANDVRDWIRRQQ